MSYGADEPEEASVALSAAQVVHPDHVGGAGDAGGEPAVMITVSPSLKRFSFTISASTRSTIASVLSTYGTMCDSTPQLSVSWLRVPSSVVKARIGWAAR